MDIEVFTDSELKEELVIVLREMSNRGLDINNLEEYIKQI